MTDEEILCAAAELAIRFEGFSAEPYPDPGSGGAPWTQGYGSTHGAGDEPIRPDSPPVSESEARAWLMRDMTASLVSVRHLVRVVLTGNQTVALTDFTYNEGAWNLGRSTLLKLLNAGDYAGAAEQFGVWVYGSGKKLGGLVRRRAAERGLFLTPDAEG